MLPKIYVRETGPKKTCCQKSTSEKQTQRHVAKNLRQRNRAKDMLPKIYVRETGPKTCSLKPTSEKQTQRHVAKNLRQRNRAKDSPRQARWRALSPFLTGRSVCSPSIFRTVRRTISRFLIELLVRRTWFGQFDELYFVLNWLSHNEMQASARTSVRRAADSMIPNVGSSQVSIV